MSVKVLIQNKSTKIRSLKVLCCLECARLFSDDAHEDLIVAMDLFVCHESILTLRTVELYTF